MENRKKGNISARNLALDFIDWRLDRNGYLKKNLFHLRGLFVRRADTATFNSRKVTLKNFNSLACFSWHAQ